MYPNTQFGAKQVEMYFIFRKYKRQRYLDMFSPQVHFLPPLFPPLLLISLFLLKCSNQRNRWQNKRNILSCHPCITFLMKLYPASCKLATCIIYISSFYLPFFIFIANMAWVKSPWFSTKSTFQLCNKVLLEVAVNCLKFKHMLWNSQVVLTLGRKILIHWYWFVWNLQHKELLCDQHIISINFKDEHPLTNNMFILFKHNYSANTIQTD